MLESIGKTSVFSGLKLTENLSHAYLLYSSDRQLNDNIALFFARSLVCENDCSCGKCSACAQFNSRSHPDVTILDQDAIKVEDISRLMGKFATLPISAKRKVFVLLNADTINEISQNKLLKSLEEPNKNNIFILTTTKTDKLLPTIMSRLNKIFVPKLNKSDKILISDELKEKGIDISPYVDKEFSLTEMIDLVSNDEILGIIEDIKNLFENLNTTADIPRVVANVKQSKFTFFAILQEVFLSALNNDTKKYDRSLVDIIRIKFNDKVILKCLPLIEEAYIKVSANVNFNYVLDNLLFNMLKEKYLCK